MRYPVDHPPPTRREFLRGAAALLSATLSGTVGCGRAASPLDARPAASPGAMLAIDMHNHVYPAGTEPHPRRSPHPGGGPPGGGPPGGGPPGGGPPGGGPPGGGPPGGGDEPGAELVLGDELARAGLTAVCAAFVLDFAPNERPGDARTTYLRWLDAVDAELARGHLARALTADDLEAARSRGTPTIVQSVEGAHFLEGELSRIEEVYRRGLRHLQLLHDKDDAVRPLGDTNTTAAHLGGLTSFGAEVLKECERLGIVVDLAHASHETVLGALAATRNPVLVSHTSLDTFTGSDPRLARMMMPRLLSKEHARVVADAGGVVGVWTHMAGSLPDFVASIRAMVEAIGIDHVGIGSDTDLLSRRVGAGTNRAWAGLVPGFFPAVRAEMERQGFARDEIAKIAGGNFARVFAAVARGRA